MEIREANVSDIPALFALATKTYVDAFGDSFTKEELAQRIQNTRSEKYFTDALERDTILVAEESGTLFGYAEFGPVDLAVETQPGDYELSRLYVAKDRQREGIGKALLERALSYPEMQRAESVWLDVWTLNEGAIKLYKSYGFEDTGIIIDGDIIMRRRHAQ